MSTNRKKLPRWYFGGISSAAACCICHPLDLLKVTLQTVSKNEPRITMFGVGRRVVREQGVGALFNGLSAAVARQLTYSTTRFAIYETVKQYYGKEMNFGEKVILAGSAGFIGGWVGTPADVVTVRMQNDMKLPPERRRNYKNVFHGLFEIGRHEGLRGLFAGASTAVGRSIAMTIGQLAFYDQAKTMLIRTGYFLNDIKTHLLASVIAGTLATAVTQPLDVLKTRAMDAKPGKYKNLVDLTIQTARLGPSAFYKGFVPRFIRLGPFTMLTFVFFEQLTQRYGFYADTGKDKKMKTNHLLPKASQKAITKND